MRVLAQNPELTETDRARFVDPDQATRRLMKLEIEKSDGGLPEIDLIRHEEWIRAAGAVHGGQIYLDMPELGAKGLARVLHIGQSPKIQSGEVPRHSGAGCQRPWPRSPHRPMTQNRNRRRTGCLATTNTRWLTEVVPFFRTVHLLIL